VGAVDDGDVELSQAANKLSATANANVLLKHWPFVHELFRIAFIGVSPISPALGSVDSMPDERLPAIVRTRLSGHPKTGH
jgi:hypothetical protein